MVKRNQRADRALRTRAHRKSNHCRARCGGNLPKEAASLFSAARPCKASKIIAFTTVVDALTAIPNSPGLSLKIQLRLASFGG
jgi:hypothetical protein